MGWLRREGADGVRFPTLLLGLFLIPLLLIALLLSLVSSSLAARVHTADRTVVALDAEGRIGDAQSTLIAEIIPTFAPVFAARVPQLQGSALSRLANATLDALGYNQSRTAQLQAATDAAIDAIGVEPDRIAEVRKDLAGVRLMATDPDLEVQDVLTKFSQVSQLLLQVEEDQQLVLARSGHSASLAADVQTAQTASELAASADLERGLLLAARLYDDQALRGEWAVEWGNEQVLASRLYATARGPVGAAWAQAQSEPAVIRTSASGQAYLDSGLAPTATLSFDAAKQIYSGVTDLPVASAAYQHVLDVAHAQVRAQVVEERRNAQRALWMVLSAAALAAVALLLVGLVLIRSVTRPLARLAEEARQISQGVLVDIQVSGPSEVRTVGRALGSAVATLRRVQSQAEALSTLDLHADVLQQAVPGPLGTVLHESIDRALASAQERDLLQQEMAHVAKHDGLTGLPNRAQFLALLTQALVRAERTGSSVALLFLDLDHFKRVNDSFGHAAGDVVLHAVAERLREEVREEDLVGRLGGDEFVVLVESLRGDSAEADEVDLLELASRLRSRVTEKVAVLGREVSVGVSIGVTVGRGQGLSAGTLLKEADAAAYRAKASGRGRVDVYDDLLREQLRSRAQLEADLAAGLERGELTLHYQPVVDLMTGEIDSVEALVRWHRPGFGMVPPGQFIPVAEQSMLICDVGRWVLHEALGQQAAWRAEGIERRVAVNVSGRHFAAARIVEDVRDALAATGVDSDMVVLELTETVVVGDGDVHQHLEQLRALGVQIALDDFGTGFTSIGQLQRLPVDVLKIDRSFVIAEDAAGVELVALMVRAAHAFDMVVIAEGIEQPEQLDRMIALGCDAAQGFLLARPVPADELANLPPAPQAVRP